MPFAGLIMYLFLTILRPADWYEPLIGLRLDVFVIGFTLVTGLFAFDLSPLQSLWKSPNGKFVTLYFLSIIASDVVSGNTEVLLQSANYFGKLYFVFLLIPLFCNSTSKIKYFNVAIVLLVAAVAFQGIQMYVTGQGWAGPIHKWGGKYERIRWVGMYDGENVFAMLLNFGIVPTIMFITGPWAKALKMLCVVAFGLILTAVFLTNSRGGYLEFMAVIACMIWIRGFREGKKFDLKRIVVVGMIMGVLLMVGPSRLEQIKDSEGSSAGRIDSWGEGIDMFKESPLIGVGVGNWTRYHHLLAHNSFVQNMGEVGFIGLFFWVAMIYCYVKGLIQMLLSNKDPKERSLLYILLTGIFGILVSSSFLTTTEFDLWFLLFGLTSSLMHITGFQMEIGRRDLFRIFAIEVTGIGMTSVAVRLFYA